MQWDFEQKRKATAQRLRINRQGVPKHIAIIMDGNRRWATEKGLPEIEGYVRGVGALETIWRYCSQIGIKYLTVYSFSIENWERPDEQVAFLMNLHAEYLKRERKFFVEEKIKFVHFGRKVKLPRSVLVELKETVRITSRNTGMNFGLALNYGARAEILEAVKRIACECQSGRLRIDSIDEHIFGDHLYTTGWYDPDLLIRTSGEMRVSNFLLWQIAGAVFHVTETYWPDFNENELDKAIAGYSRSRNNGLS